VTNYRTLVAKFLLHNFMMNQLLTDVIDRTQSEIIKIQSRENNLEAEQQTIAKKITELREKIQQSYHQQTQMELEIVELLGRERELKTKLVKLLSIANVTESLNELVEKIQNDRSLMELFYTSINTRDRELKSLKFNRDKNKKYERLNSFPQAV
jgi:chromosome segregation ATPase